MRFVNRLLKKGDPCPCCGSPIPTDDPVTLGLLSIIAHDLGLPMPAAPQEVSGDG